MWPPSNGSSGTRLKMPTNTLRSTSRIATCTQPDSVACTARRLNPTIDTKRAESSELLLPLPLPDVASDPLSLLSVRVCQYALMPDGENRLPSSDTDSVPMFQTCFGDSTNAAPTETDGITTSGAIPA